MNYNLQSLDRAEKEFGNLFSQLSNIQSKIHKLLQQHADGKVLKGNELVGWLGEIYTKIVLNGHLVDDSYEHDVQTEDGWSISVKTRKGLNSGWTRSSAIPRIEGEGCPTHLMFVHLNADYGVSDMWLYPWEDLISQGRFKEHIVRGNFRSYYMSVKPSQDNKYKIYSSALSAE